MVSIAFCIQALHIYMELCVHSIYLHGVCTEHIPVHVNRILHLPTVGNLYD